MCRHYFTIFHKSLPFQGLCFFFQPALASFNSFAMPPLESVDALSDDEKMKTPKRPSALRNPTPKAKSPETVSAEPKAKPKKEPKAKPLKRPAASATSAASPLKRPATAGKAGGKGRHKDPDHISVCISKYKSNGVWSVKLAQKEVIRVTWRLYWWQLLSNFISRFFRGTLQKWSLIKGPNRVQLWGEASSWCGGNSDRGHRCNLALFYSIWCHCRMIQKKLQSWYRFVLGCSQDNFEFLQTPHLRHRNQRLKTPMLQVAVKAELIRTKGSVSAGQAIYAAWHSTD